MRFVSRLSAIPTGTTNLSADGRTMTHSRDSGTDLANTGWALFRPNTTSSTMSFDVVQEAQDGIGFTLAYVCESGLVVRKVVEGAPSAFSGAFSVLVSCMTAQGLTQTPVTLTWPSSPSATVPGIPAGSTCKVVESSNLPAPPAGFNWSGTTYAPANGVVVTSAAGTTVTVTNSMRPCRNLADVRIIKKVEGAPSGFAGIFNGTLSCWVGGKLTDFPVTLDVPTVGFYTVRDLPLGTVCTFEETTRPALPAGYQWLPPVYSRPFGQVTLVEACLHELTVTNRVQLCCDAVGMPNAR